MCARHVFSVFLGLWLFVLIMILLSVSAVGYDAWQDVKARNISHPWVYGYR